MATACVYYNSVFFSDMASTGGVVLSQDSVWFQATVKISGMQVHETYERTTASKYAALELMEH